MGGAERIVGTFGALGEAGEAAFAAQGTDTVAATGQDLVGIALVADIPDDLVARGVKDRVQGDGQFDNAEARAKVAAGDGNGADGFGAQLVGQLAQLAVGQTFDTNSA